MRTGIAIEAARDYRRMTQGEVAERVGTSVSTVSRYEAGADRMDALVLAGIARTLDVPLDWLLVDPPETREEMYERLALRAAQQRAAGRAPA